MAVKKAEAGAGAGKELVLKKLQDAMDFVKSEKVVNLIAMMNGSLTDQQSAMNDVSKYLEKNGIKLPPDVTFATEPGVAHGKLKAKVRVTLYKA